MVRVNPAQSDTGNKYSPTYHVTAVFDSFDDLEPLVDSLIMAGFTDRDIEIFAGEEGAERLDFRGKHQGVIRRIINDLAMMLSDESKLQEQLDHVLRDGGVVVSAHTHGDEEKKKRAMLLLKTANGKQISYWGPLAVERPEAKL